MLLILISLQSSQVQRTPPPPPLPPLRFHYLKVESVGSCRFQIHLFIHAWWPVNLYARQLCNFCLLSLLTFDVCRLQSNFVHSKIFHSDRIQRGYCKKKFTAHHACRNADSNLIHICIDFLYYNPGQNVLGHLRKLGTNIIRTLLN